MCQNYIVNMERYVSLFKQKLTPQRKKQQKQNLIQIEENKTEQITHKQKLIFHYYLPHLFK